MSQEVSGTVTKPKNGCKSRVRPTKKLQKTSVIADIIKRRRIKRGWLRLFLFTFLIRSTTMFVIVFLLQPGINDMLRIQLLSTDRSLNRASLSITFPLWSRSENFILNFRISTCFISIIPKKISITTTTIENKKDKWTSVVTMNGSTVDMWIPCTCTSLTKKVFTEWKKRSRNLAVNKTKIFGRKRFV